VDTGRELRTNAASGAAVSTAPDSGRLLDQRYLVGRRIARGGMASVYEATDTRLHRQVAIKIMHPGLGDAMHEREPDDGGSAFDSDSAMTFAERFVREARASARLTHENIVGVYDQGEDQGTVYLVMEYVPGHTLRDLIRAQAPMSPARALVLIEPVLAALAAAHRAGLIHRDVKPENVLIADDGRIKVADFGLAKAVSTDTQHTATAGVLIGTVSYLAPELVVNGSADARADVYAAGVLLYEMLTGRKPHEGESPIQVAYQHVHADVPAPSNLVPAIPAYVDALVARATARDRDLRPADAGVLLHQVRRVRQALADGLLEDPELTEDLTPLVAHAASGSEQTAATSTPEPYAELFAADGFGSEPTTSLVVDPGPSLATTRPPASRGMIVAQPRRSRRGPILLVAALLVMALLGGSAWWFGAGRFTPTPGVIGMTEADAEQTLSEAGLEMDLAPAAYSETVPAGQVAASDPEAGSRILDGGTVSVVLSLGKERYDVPRLRGKTEDQAQDAILGTKLEIGKTTEVFDEKVPLGKVISTEPAAGTSLKPGASVDLVISKGKRPIELKDWTGKDAQKAVSWAEKKGLEPATSSDFSTSVPEGRVISQSPATGSLFAGDRVSFVVSKGPELVVIPSGLRASGVDAATRVLKDLGFKVKVRESSGYLGLGFVYSVDPTEGTALPVGSTVTLYLV
jgi:serine/threonine protein kinase/beta-lactam-binding protein with PASTA domain